MAISKRNKGRGQAAVEFAMLGAVGMILVLVAVQLAIIGQIDLALSHMTYQGARYAAAHEGCGQTSCTGSDSTFSGVQTYMLSVGSSVFSNNSSNLTVSVSPSSRSFSQSLTVTTSFTIPSSLIFLPNPFMGKVWLPTQLNSAETAMSE